MSGRILIIEDDEAIRENLRDILEMEGYTPTEASNGRVALESLRKSQGSGLPLPQLILLDLNMPVMSGREFLELLKNEVPEVANIPVVIMTAAPDAHEISTAGFMRKPVDLDRLLETLIRLTSSRSPIE